MNKQTATSTSLDTPLKIKVVRLNQLPLYLIGALLIIILIGGVELLPHRKAYAKNYLQLNSTAQIATATDKDWYQNQSNALPKYHLAIPRSKVITDENSLNTEYKKRRAQALLAAMNSPLTSNSTTKNFNEENNHQNSTDTIIKNSPLNSSNSISTNSSLAMSLQQINKLQHLFGIDANQNQQHKQLDFIHNLKNSEPANYLNEEVSKPLSPYELKAGSLIPAIMMGGINSDLPGQVTAQVRQNVYDTVSGKYLLIPQGAHLILTYDNRIIFGQNRILIAVKRIIFPNGKSLDIDGMPGVDINGYSGFHDQTNNHYLKIFGSAAGLGLISAAFQLSQPQQSNTLSNLNAGQTVAGAVGQPMAQVGSNMINKNLNVPPTLEVRPGYLFNVQITADMVFPGVYNDEQL